MGAAPRTAPPFAGSGAIEVAGVALGRQPLAIVVVGGVLVAAVWFLLERTQIGRRMRAVASDRHMARAVGIPVGRYVTLSLALAGALAGVAGFLLGHQFLVTPTQGAGHMLKAYIAVALGGWGSVPGALLGALAIGVFETFVSAAVGDAWASAALYVAVLARAGGPPAAACSASRSDGAPDMRARSGWSCWCCRRSSALVVLPPFGQRLVTLVGIYALLGLGYQLVFGQLRRAQPGAGRACSASAPMPRRCPRRTLGGRRLASSRSSPRRSSAALAAGPILRLQSHYFALATLALASLVNLVAVHAESLTGGANGLVGFAPALPRGPDPAGAWSGSA